MKALTIRQPWATLIARGAKTIETRSWTTKYRGPIAIHAGKSPRTWRDLDAPYLMSERETVTEVLRALDVYDDKADQWPSPLILTEGIFLDWTIGKVPTLPLGAVVAVAELVDVVPIEDLDGDAFDADTLDHGRVVYTASELDPELLLEVRRHVHPPIDRDVSDERRFGDYTAGRWAWLLEDVEPLERPVSATGRQGLWTVDHDLALELVR